MPKYLVQTTITQHYDYEFVIEAESEDAACKKAEDIDIGHDEHNWEFQGEDFEIECITLEEGEDATVSN